MGINCQRYRQVWNAGYENRMDEKCREPRTKLYSNHKLDSLFKYKDQHAKCWPQLKWMLGG